MSPWRRLCPDAVKSLGDVVFSSNVDLSTFCGVSSRYSAGQFADVGFLCSHCCKEYFTCSSVTLILSVVFVFHFSLFHFSVVFFYLQCMVLV